MREVEVRNICKYSKKQGFRSKKAVIIAIRMDDKWGICAPYFCKRCKLWHMTSDKKTVGKFYGR